MITYRFCGYAQNDVDLDSMHAEPLGSQVMYNTQVERRTASGRQDGDSEQEIVVVVILPSLSWQLAAVVRVSGTPTVRLPNRVSTPVVLHIIPQI